jgi:Bacterial archaeo-eukaryotic release factor family 5
VSLEWSRLRTLAEMSDPVGILSLYVTADPHDESSQPAWRVRARTELKRLRDRAKQSGSRDYYAAVTSRLDDLEGDLETLLDARLHGIGRALFAAISDGYVDVVTLQVPLIDDISIATTPHVRPLVTAWSMAGPAGVVVVSVDEIRFVDLRFGHATDVAAIPHPEDVADRRELTGKGRATVATHHSSASHHDLFDQREEDRLLRYLHGLGGTIAEYVRDRGWEYLAVTGEFKYARMVADGLPPHLPADIVTLGQVVTSLTAPKVATVVGPALDDARARRRSSLAERARDAALSPNAEHGVLGLEATLGALQEKRVAHLLLAADGAWSGRRSPDGTLTTEYDTPPGVDPATLQPDPRLDERMIELAFREDAAITVLDGDEGAPLADAEGIGAILRW